MNKRINQIIIKISNYFFQIEIERESQSQLWKHKSNGILIILMRLLKFVRSLILTLSFL